MTTDNNDTLACANCGHENPAGTRFCTSCGSPLTAQAVVPQPDPLALIAQLRDDVDSLSSRFGVIESRLGLRPAAAPATPPPAAPVQPPAPVPPAAPVAPPPTPVTPPRPAETVGAASAAPPAPVIGTRAAVSALAASASGAPRVTPPPSAASRYPSARSPLSTIDWEAILGRNWFAIIGAIALALGAAFFLKLAIDNHWISETARVLMGLVTGLVLLGLGEYTARRIPRWSQPVTGGGLSILYLATYASFGFYQLIEPVFALAFLLVVVAVAAVLAIRHESRIIALMGITGAFLAPLLLAGDMGDQRIALLAYVLIVDLGILVVSSFYSWQWFIRIGMFATYLLFGWWIDTIPASETIVAELGVVTAFLIFVGATTLFHVIRRQVPTVWDLGLMVVNAVSFSLATIALMWNQYEGWFGLISLLIGVFYAGVGLAVVKRKGAPRQVARYSMLIALVFGTLSAPLQLNGFWITIAWAIEAAVLVGASFRFRSDRARMFALGVFALAIARVLVLDTFAQSISEFDLFTSDRIPAFAVTIVALYIAAFFYHRNAALASEWEKDLGHGLIVGANVLSLWILTAEVFSFYENRAQETALFQAQEAAKNSQILAITTMWAIYASGLVAIAYARNAPVLRWLAIGLSSLVTAKFVLYDTFAIGTTRSSNIFGANFYFASGVGVFALLVFAVIMTARYRHQLLPGERHLYSALVVAAGLVGVWVLSSEVISFFGNRANLSETQVVRDNAFNFQISAVSVAWALYAAIAIGIAYLRRIIALRGFALGLIALLVAKFTLYDTVAIGTTRSADLFGANSYFASGVLVFALLMLALFLTARYRDQLLPQEFHLQSVLVVAGAVVGIWTLTSEVYAVFQGSLNSQLSGVTTTWALYGAATLGIAYVRRIVALRAFALGLIGLVAAKFVLYDTSALTSPESSILLAANFYFASAVVVFATLMFAAYMTNRHRDQLLPLESNLYNGLVVLANAVALWGLSVESWRFFTGLEARSTGDLDSAKHLTLTILWTVYAMGLITLGVLRQSRTLRLAGIGLMLLPIAKLFGFDVFLLEQGYRVAAFVSLGVILLALGLVYQKYSEVFRGFFMAASSDAEMHRVAQPFALPRIWLLLAIAMMLVLLATLVGVLATAPTATAVLPTATPISTIPITDIEPPTEIEKTALIDDTCVNEDKAGALTVSERASLCGDDLIHNYLMGFAEKIKVTPIVLEGELSQSITYQSWSFDGEQDQMLRFDPRPKPQSHIDFGHVQMTLFTGYWSEEDSEMIARDEDLGEVELPETGTYTLSVEGNPENSSGAYTITISRR